ncbi:hypothetical protein F4778DRAFT_772545 [Xylariomycetidae sp. FL2044]|nr:hypothetical protein F4778DRAFT_772545 [Xylariomycetidae sp. FL2044]
MRPASNHIAPSPASPPKPSPGACERCHRYKEKCSFGRGRRECLRCMALGEPCRSRLRKRMGRRPTAHKLPYGNTSVISLVSFSASASASTSPPPQDLPVAAKRRQNPARSRRPSRSVPRPALVLLRSPSSSHWQIGGVLGTAEGFFAVHRSFMLGRSFATAFQAAVRLLFARSPQLLTDVYTIAMKLLRARHAVRPRVDGHDLAIGTRCVQRLMDASSACIADAEDAAVTVLLGQALLVYNMLAPMPATQVIMRGTLLCVRRWFPSLLGRPELDSVTLTPVLIDTVECLLRRDLPVIRLPFFFDRCIVDRCMGVCLSLFPLLYDLCERSYQAKVSGCERPSAGSLDEAVAEGDDFYSDIERRVRDWTPDLPPAFFTMYPAVETSFMLAQARSYQLATLLVIHRLRFPLGIQDGVVRAYAEDILEEVSILKTWPPDAPTGLGLDFPLLVATLELPETGTAIYRAFEPLRFRKQHSRQILDFIQFVTTARESGYNGLWFDLVENKLHGVTVT